MIDGQFIREGRRDAYDAITTILTFVERCMNDDARAILGVSPLGVEQCLNNDDMTDAMQERPSPASRMEVGLGQGVELVRSGHEPIGFLANRVIRQDFPGLPYMFLVNLASFDRATFSPKECQITHNILAVFHELTIAADQRFFHVSIVGRPDLIPVISQGSVKLGQGLEKSVRGKGPILGREKPAILRASQLLSSALYFEGCESSKFGQIISVCCRSLRVGVDQLE